ncbi:MAG: hypothetical protein ACTS22_09945 [Phycisphaerales bacterium]
MFATDRDLLVYEPRLFLDIGWLGQRLVRVNGAVSGGVAVAVGTDFASLGVGVGSVVSFGDGSYEVVQVLGVGQLALSRLRVSPSEAVIPPGDAASTLLEATTFAPQMGVVHRQVLRMLGIEPEDPREGALTETAVANPGALTRLECLGTLHLVFAAASASAVPGSIGGSGLGQRALMYRERFAAERARVSVLIDADGDGEPESTRRPGVGHLVRG